MKFKNPKIEKLYEHISGISHVAYLDRFLISNDVLCKQYTSGQMVETILSAAPPQKTTIFFVTKKVLSYFAKNLVAYLLYLITVLAHNLSRQVFRFPEKGELLLIDTYCVFHRTLAQNRFWDSFFPGLADALSRRKKEYAYALRFFGTRNPFKLFQVFRVLKKNGDQVLTEFQLLQFADYLEAVKFIFLYPFSVWRLTKNLGNSYEDQVLRHSLWQTFDCVAFDKHIRYLFGKRLSSIKMDKIKCLSWYENQAFEKNFYRGLRSNSKKPVIVGAQLFVRPHELLNIVPDDDEAPFDLIPDKILVNGPGYQFESEHTQVNIGPSLRYAHLFNTEIHPSEGTNILVLLPLWDDAVSNILRILCEVDWSMPVEIKFHPSTNRKILKTNLPKNSLVTDKNLPELLMKARIVIGGGSGSQVEAAALGIPVIDIQEPNRFSYSCMPEIGRGILWDRAADAEGVKGFVNRFQEALRLTPNQLKKEGARLKSVYFSEPTDELIGQAFELD
jgi:hypothetical protein